MSSVSRRTRRPARTAAVGVGLLTLVASACGGASNTAGSATGATGATGSNGTSAPGSFPTDHTLHLSFLQDPGQPPDPDVYYAGEGLLLTRNLYEGLVQYQSGTADRKIIPSLATSWTVSPDGLTYTFQLRQGVTFHDGTPFTSAAVKASFDRRAAVNGGPAYMVSGVTVTAPSASIAVLALKTPNTAFLDFLASAYGPVMESPTALAANAGKDHDQTYLQTHDIGTGPYTLSQSKVGVGYELRSYPAYWGSKPYYTTVELPVVDNLSSEEIQFNNGQLAGILHDLTTTAAVQYQQSSKVGYYTLPVLESEEMYVNEYQGFLTSQAARQALLSAVNIPAIVAGVFPGGRAKVPTQTAPPHLISAQVAQQHVTYDPSMLKGVVKALPSAQRSITIGYDTGATDDQLIAEQIGAQLQADGLSPKIVGYQTSSIYGWIGSTSLARSNATPNLLIDYFWPDADTPYTWSHITYDATGGLNYLTCNVPGLADLDAQAVRSGNLALYDQVSSQALASGCWLNMAAKSDTMVFQSWMHGVTDAHVVGTPEALLLSKLYPG